MQLRRNMFDRCACEGEGEDLTTLPAFVGTSEQCFPLQSLVVEKNLKWYTSIAARFTDL